MSSRPPHSQMTRAGVRRLAASVLGTAIVAIALNGCVAFNGTGFSQQGLIGDINLDITGCGSKADTQGCALGSTHLESNSTGTGQALIGVRMLSRYTPPSTFTTGGPTNQPFVLSPSYTAELNRLAPPGDGVAWTGYISDARSGYVPGQKITARLPVGRPPLPDGSANGSSFGASVVVGARGVTDDAPADRPVACGTSLTTVNEVTICEDSTGGGGATGSFHDFAFLTPAPVTVQPGQTALIPVTGTFGGFASPKFTFALTASTTLTDTSALVNVPTLAPPSDSTTVVTMSVPVPASATPGTYTATLTGTLSSGESRSTTSTLTVSAPGGATAGGATAGGAGLSLSRLTISRTSISTARRAAPSVLSVTLSQPGRLRILVERRVAGRTKTDRRCVAPTRRLIRASARRCLRFIRVSSVTRDGLAAGAATFTLSGRTNGRRRTAGVYRVTFTTLSPTGVAGPSLRATLTVRR